MTIHSKQWNLFLVFSLCFIYSVVAVPSSTLRTDYSGRGTVVHSEGGRTETPRLWSSVLRELRRIFVISNPDENHDYVSGLSHARPSTQYSSYADQVVVRFNVTTAEETNSLAEACITLFLDVWNISYDYVDIKLGINDLAPLLGLLPDSLQHAHQPLLHGQTLANAVEDTFPHSPQNRLSEGLQRKRSFTADLRTTDTSEFFREYRPLEVLVPWMRLLESLFSANVRLISVGRSWEGRDIYGLRVGVHPTNDEKPLEPRKTVLVTGGSHAREWISVSTVSYVMYNFIVGYGRDSDITTLLEQLDFVFVPTLNPDGFVYTWKYDRLWRKTRQPSPIAFCHGIDIDRSWSYEWDTGQHGLSPNPCSENYAGERPFDSVEARSFVDWMHNETTSNNITIISMIDLHSYSQSVLVPYAYSCADLPPNYEELVELGLGMSRAIKRTYGEFFEVLSACQDKMLGLTKGRIQDSHGSPLDWFHHDMDVKYSYQIKLRDTGSYGFLVPPDYIVPSGQEIFNAVMFLGRSLTSDDSVVNSVEPDRIKTAYTEEFFHLP